MLRRSRAELPPGLTEDDLPVWMRHTRRTPDWLALAVIGLCAVLLAPLLLRPGLPAGYDPAVARAVEMRASLEANVPYPRWAPNFNYGYGSPLWNYLPPLPHYLTGLYHVAVQAGAEASVKAVVALSVLLAGIGMLGFVRARWGPLAGLLAAVAYLANPQVTWNMLYLEGDLAGLLALGVFPWLLISVDRLLAMGRGTDFGAVVAVTALLWLTDAPANLLLVGLTGGWVAWLSLSGRGQGGGRGTWHAVAALALGTAAAAFFWLPALVESYAVVWLPVAVPDGAHHAWAPLALLLPPEPADPRIVNPAPTASIGVGLWALALLGAGSALVRRWRGVSSAQGVEPGGRQAKLTANERAGLYFFGAGCLLWATAALLPGREGAWLDWRGACVLVGVACGAVAAGQGGAVLEAAPRRRRVIGACVLLAGLALLNAPLLDPPAWPAPRTEATAITVLGREVRGHLIGGVRSGWLLPSSAPVPPGVSPVLVNSYDMGQVDRVLRDALPPSVQVDVIEQTPRQQRLVVDAAQAATLTLLAFDYPGWQAEIDNEPATLGATAEQGFLTLRVPAGRHEVRVYFGSTAPRRAAWLIALVAAGVATALSLRLERDVPRRAAGASPANEAGRSGPFEAAILAAVTLAVFGLAAAYIREWRGADPPDGGPAGHDVAWELQGGIDLVDYEIAVDGPFAPGDRVRVTLYWQAVRPDLPDYQAGVALVDAEDPTQAVVSVAHRHPGGIPVSQWPQYPRPDSVVRDEYVLRIGTDVPPGRYRIAIQVGQCGSVDLRPCESVEPLFAWGSEGQSLSQLITLPGAIDVR